MQLPGGYLLEVINGAGSSNSAELRSQLLVHLVQSLGQLRSQQVVQNLDLQLPMAAVQPCYLATLAVLVPTRPPLRPVG